MSTAAGQLEDEGFRQTNFASLARQGLIEHALQLGLGEEGIFRCGGGEELRPHLGEDDILRRVRIAEGDAEVLVEAGLQGAGEHAEVVAFTGGGCADDGEDVVRRVHEAGGQLPAAVRAGEVRRGEAHGIQSLAAIIEAGGVEALHGVFTQEWISAQGGVHGDVHGISPVKLEPADGAGELTILHVHRLRVHGLHKVLLLDGCAACGEDVPDVFDEKADVMEAAGHGDVVLRLLLGLAADVLAHLLMIKGAIPLACLGIVEVPEGVDAEIAPLRGIRQPLESQSLATGKESVLLSKLEGELSSWGAIHQGVSGGVGMEGDLKGVSPLLNGAQDGRAARGMGAEICRSTGTHDEGVGGDNHPLSRGAVQDANTGRERAWTKAGHGVGKGGQGDGI